MAETKTQSAEQHEQSQQAGRRKIVVGEVVSSRMHKTIVVQVVRKKAHPFYGRVVSKAKKFYAHDEKNVAQVEAVAAEGSGPACCVGAGSGSCRRGLTRFFSPRAPGRYVMAVMMRS